MLYSSTTARHRAGVTSYQYPYQPESVHGITPGPGANPVSGLDTTCHPCQAKRRPISF
ncbi:hypothetical protein BJV78DRAFT_1191371 [Lactifluus subvellereus]|nr:hypothetical protein BJV78DRAFT_1191371 [Lactifluus subvellereus]